MRYEPLLALTALITALAVNTASAQETPARSHSYGNGESIRVGEDGVPSAFFDTMMEVMTGAWEGQYTNGTFEDPTDWKPVRVEYRLTSKGSALVEDYLFGAGSEVGMTTVYFKDNNDLRLTHYCGAQNHPSMIAHQLDAGSRSVAFDFTGVTNLDTPQSYHSRRMEVNIISDDHIQILYRGLKNGEVYSQAYDLRRAR